MNIDGKETSDINQQPMITESMQWIPLLPLRNVVILPKTIQPIIVGRPSSIKAVETALRQEKYIFVTAQKNPNTENPTLSDLHTIGTKSSILQVMRLPNGALKILVEGLNRAEIQEIECNEELSLVTSIDLHTTDVERTIETEALWRQIQSLYTQIAKLNEHVPPELMALMR